MIGEVEDPRPWTDREGNQRASLEVTAQIVRFIGGRGDGTPGGGGEHTSNEQGDNASNEEDIPF